MFQRFSLFLADTFEGWLPRRRLGLRINVPDRDFVLRRLEQIRPVSLLLATTGQQIQLAKGENTPCSADSGVESIQFLPDANRQTSRG